MAIAILYELPGGTKEQYEATLEGLDQAGALPPDGQKVHVSGPIEGGWFVLDVWETQEQFEKFEAEYLGAIAAKAGLPSPKAHGKVIPIHSFFTK